MILPYNTASCLTSCMNVELPATNLRFMPTGIPFSQSSKPRHTPRCLHAGAGMIILKGNESTHVPGPHYYQAQRINAVRILYTRTSLYTSSSRSRTTESYNHQQNQREHRVSQSLLTEVIPLSTS